MFSPALCSPEELANLPVILTQMQNFMKSNGAQPIGPLVQAIVEGTGPDQYARHVHDAAGHPDDHPAWSPATTWTLCCG